MRETPTIAQTELGQRMRPGIPWSIKGVEPQAREAAKIAARRAGMTLGEWLNTVLLDADDFAPEPDYRPPHRAAGRYEAPRYGPEVHERLDDLATQIGRLAQRQADTAVSRVVEPKIDLNPLSDLVRGLVDRMERSEKRSVDSMEEFDRRLNRLSDKLIHDIGRGDSAGTAGTQGFERALKNIVDHIEQNERRHSESFKSIQSKIGELATRLTAVPAEATRPNAQLLSGLERRLAELGDRIDRMERRSQDSSPVKVIEDRLGHLVEQVREQAKTVSSMARSHEGTAAVDPASFVSRTELQKIQSRIEDIVNRLEDPVHGNPDAAIAQMQEEIASLSRNLADVRIEAASIQDMRALRQAIDGISAQLADGSPAGGAGDQAIAQMQDEIAALSQSIAAMSAGSASGQDVDDIRDGLRQVAEQIQYLQASGGGADDHLRGEIATINAMIAQIRDEAASIDDIHALRATLDQVAAQQGQAGGRGYEALERRIEEMARRLDRSGGDGSSMDHIAELEARIQDLYARIDQAPLAASGDDAYQTLETQVATLFDRLSAIEHQGAGGAPVAGSPYDTAIEALERGLQNVQTSNERSDRRTQETLEAVHETLEKVVNRLARLEEASKLPAEPDDGEPRATETLPHQQPHREAPAAAPERPAPDLRLPPIIGLDDIRDSVAAPSGPHGDAAGPDRHPAERSMPRIGRTDDFIAAARRAAQASPQVAVAETRKKRPILEFLTRRMKSERAGKDAKSGKLRTVLLAAAVALLAIGALSTIQLTQTRTSKVAVEGPDTTRPATKASRLEAPSGKPAADSVESVSPTAGGDFDRPINPQSLPSAAGTRKPQAALDRAPGVTELAKTSLTHAPAAGMPDPPPLPDADPLTTGSIPTGKAADAVPGSKNEERVSMQASALTANRVASVDRTGGDRPAASPRPTTIRTTPDSAMSGETLPPAEIGPMSLRVAAASGSPAAQYEVAARYTEGRIIAQDFRKAAMWYQRAAAKGMAPAQYRLGTLYEKGRGVPADKAAARIWYERAAEKGNRKAMHNLAVLYADTSDGNPNYAKAAMWFRNAAELGLADSQFNYGILTERGLGVRKDLKDAYRWFAIAARNGDKGADERLLLVEKQMPPDDLVAVKLQIESWQPREPVREANIVEIPSGGWGATSGSASAKPAPAPENRSTIAEVQNLLNNLGYNAGVADGVLGPRTRDAIRDFERDQGLATTGMVTRGLIEKLNAQPG
jgi:localization factor PodJL